MKILLNHLILYVMEQNITHEKGDFSMLGIWRPHSEYVAFVLTALRGIAATGPERLFEFQELISRMLILDLDPVKEIIASLYSDIGAPAKNQPGILRSLILQSALKMSLTDFHDKLSVDYVIRTMAGFTRENIPGIVSFYDFNQRVYDINEDTVIRPPYAKPKNTEKLKKGEKMPPKNPNITARLADMIINHQAHFESLLNRRKERYLQKIFSSVSLDKSVALGIIPKTFSSSGDGTCIATGACPNGKKVCKCMES
jgi:hypothetical protein